MNAHRTAATPARCAIMVVSLVAALLAPGALHAQIAVFPVQNLSFGTLRPGAAELVDTDDPVRRAEFELVGSGNVVVSVALPTEMVSASGARLSLSFSKKDAALEERGSGKVKSFDPHKSRHFNIKDRDGGARIYLGGMALPDASQPPGRYTATVVIQIVAAGT